MDQRRSQFSASFSLDRYWSIECFFPEPSKNRDTKIRGESPLSKASDLCQRDVHCSKNHLRDAMCFDCDLRLVAEIQCDVASAMLRCGE